MNFFTKMEREDGSTEPPVFPHPAPRLGAERWSLPDAELERAAGHDAAQREKFRVARPYPSSAHLVFSQMRFIMAGELAGAWASFGGIGAQWTDLAQVALTGSA